MFSAIVLVCATMVDDKSCFTLKPNTFFDTYAECRQSIEHGIDIGVFSFVDKSGVTYSAVDHTCVNWKAKKI